MKKNQIGFLKKLLLLKNLFRDTLRQPMYRLLSVEKTKTDEYIATIQLVKKGFTFQMKPEEILANDAFTDEFSPRDIRALTYLGYLGINSPKYKILAKRLIENEKNIFIVHEKGTENINSYTAQDLSKNKDMLKKLVLDDAHSVIYTAATEDVEDEKKLKEEAIMRENNNGN